MTILNKGDLITQVKRYLKRSDLDDLLPDWVDYATKRIDQDCKLPEQEFRSQSVATSRYVALPTDFIDMRNIQGNSVPLEYVTPERMDALRLGTFHGQLRYYTIFNRQIELLPHPSTEAPYDLEIFYFAKMAALVSDNDTNPILLNQPQLYLYACMIEAMPFLEFIEGQASWVTMYTDARDLLNKRAENGRFSGNSLHLRTIN